MSVDQLLLQPQCHIALYGPPGAGKSTLVFVVKKMGWKTLDLEDAGSTCHKRLAAVDKYKDGKSPWTLFGAADIAPESFPKGTKFVLLAPDEGELIARVQGRNDTRAHKWIEHAKKVRGEHLQ